MRLSQVANEVFRIDLGMVSAFLIAREGLTLVDTGLPGSETAILKAITLLGRRPEDVRDILITHLHADHTGSAAALKARTGARVWMHTAEARDLAAGVVMRPFQPGPGFMNKAVVSLFMRGEPEPVAPFESDLSLDSTGDLGISGGLIAIPSPGHTLGHRSFLWPHEGGVLFVGDACGAMFGLGASPIYEDYELGMASLEAFGDLDFDTACFSHGSPLLRNARRAFRRTWPRSA